MLGCFTFSNDRSDMSTEIMGAHKPVCPTCGSKNANGYWGMQYDDEVPFEPMECDDCGTTFNCLWVRAGIDDVKSKREKI
jgi:hypothetical protein